MAALNVVIGVVALSDCQCSNNTPFGPLDAEKIPEAFLLYVFTMAFPTSPFIVREIGTSAIQAEMLLNASSLLRQEPQECRDQRHNAV